MAVASAWRFVSGVMLIGRVLVKAGDCGVKDEDSVRRESIAVVRNIMFE